MICPHGPHDIYEINTRLWLGELGVTRLGDVPDAAIDALAERFDWVWLMGVWTPSPYAEYAAKNHPLLREECRRALPDVTTEDIVASPYAIGAYRVSDRLGGPGELARLRERLARRGVRLMLDFVPNHTGCDHPLALERPELYVGAGPGAAAGDTFVTPSGARLFHGRDPHFPPWTDTAQLDARRRSTRRALGDELLAVARQCDGVRCDMAMLLLRDVFERTWDRAGVLAPPPADRAGGELWPELVDRVRAEMPGFVFLAEAYWGTEARLHALGFDFTYDKTLYDHLVEGRAREALAQVGGEPRSQWRALRFLENHDEERAAARMPADLYRAAALVTFTLPGMRLLHHGQLEGARRRVPVQLTRRAAEPVDHDLARFLRELAVVARDPVLRAGAWMRVEPRPAWDGNASHDAFFAAAWDASFAGVAGGAHRLLAVNLATHRAQCRLPLALPGLAARQVRVRELFATGATPPGEARAEDGRPIQLRAGDELTDPGLYVELPPRTGQLVSIGP
ncbi:MAG: alpha-amylase family glycosyl hydrolase [Polyangiaceae bacterium]